MFEFTDLDFGDDVYIEFLETFNIPRSRVDITQVFFGGDCSIIETVVKTT
jgi:hypothetical protein